MFYFSYLDIHIHADILESPACPVSQFYGLQAAAWQTDGLSTLAMPKTGDHIQWGG